MAMTPRLWTINGLATELRKDRRTIGKALSDVPPDGRVNGGHRGWYMSTALRAMSTELKFVHRASCGAPGFEVVDQAENPMVAGQLLVLTYVGYKIGWMAASMAVMAGAPMKSAYALFYFMREAFAMEAELLCAALDLGDFKFTDGEVFDPGLVEKPDWEHLAKLANEPVDIPSWHAWATERSQGSN